MKRGRRVRTMVGSVSTTSPEGKWGKGDHCTEVPGDMP